MRGLLLSGKLKKVLIGNIDLFNYFMYVDEIIIEKEVFKKFCGIFGRLLVFFLVILYMLFVFNYYKLGDIVNLYCFL